MQIDNDILARLVQWAEPQASIRAMLLTSSMVVPNAPVDVLSDYDVILVVADIQPFFDQRAWLGDFGPVLAVYRDPIQIEAGLATSAYVTQYEAGLKIDFTLWPVDFLRRVVAAPHLPAELDAGYRVILDKDHMTDGLKPPSYRAYIPTPPTSDAYHESVEVFFLETAYVAKFLWRDDLMAAKHILDNLLKQEHLRPMLEWRSEIDHQWSVKPGPYGRRLKQWLRPELWAELEGTYAGAGLEANWEALFRTIALFRKVALEVGDRLGYVYPADLDRRACAYLQQVRTLEHPEDIHG